MEELRRNIRGESYRVLTIGCGSPVLLLHGFTGSCEVWKPVVPEKIGVQWIVPDLLGHGRTSSPVNAARYDISEQVADLVELMAELGHLKFACCGYSMGGRVALALTALKPGVVSRLTLESSSPGLKTEREQAERRKRDNDLARHIETVGVREFIREWEDIPLFASQKQLPLEKRLAVRSIRLQNNALGLANSLRGMGTGAQPSYWRQLNRMKLPVLLITGEKDTKFCGVAREMSAGFPHSLHRVIPLAGHTVHVEKPEEFRSAMLEFLDSSM